MNIHLDEQLFEGEGEAEIHVEYLTRTEPEKDMPTIIRVGGNSDKEIPSFRIDIRNKTCVFM